MAGVGRRASGVETLGRYRLLQPVARGGMGEVWRGQDPAGRPVALKLLLAGRQATPAQRKRFATEAAALQRVRHAGVVALLEAGEQDRLPYLALEWVDGETLAERLRRTGPLAPRAAAELGLRLALALAHCHRQGVLHRDLKPDNVLLRAGDDAPLLLDFGLARALLPDVDVSAATRTGQFLGTPGWWSPEQARGERERIGPASDVFGLGAVLYAALTGRPPRQVESLTAELDALDRRPEPPSRLRSGGAGADGVPAWLDAVCLRALEPDPGRRFPHADALARALARGTSGRARSARAPLLVGGALLGVGLIGLLGLAGQLGARTGGAGSASAPAPTPAQVPDQTAVQPAPPDGLIPVSPGGRAPSPEVAALIQRAIERARARDKGALSDLDRAIALGPDCAQAWMYRGMLREDLGDLPGALADLDRAVALDPALTKAWVERGTARLMANQLEAARGDLDRALSLDPDAVAALVNRAVVVRQLGDPRAALRDLERAAGLASGNSVVWEESGRCRAALGDRAGARGDLDRAIALGPRPTAHLERGLLERQEGRLDRAVEDFQRATELAPGDVRGWSNLAAARHEAGDPRAALQAITRAVELDPHEVQALYNRALILKDLGQPAAALADLEQLVREHPRDAEVHCDRAQVLHELGRAGEALQAYDRCLELDPRLVRAWANRGLLRRKLGHPDEALRDLNMALSLQPTFAIALAGRGLVRAGQGDHEAARADLVRALELEPDAFWSAEARAELERLR